VKGYFYSDKPNRSSDASSEKVWLHNGSSRSSWVFGLERFHGRKCRLFEACFLETAHPGKFRETVERVAGLKDLSFLSDWRLL